MGLVQVIILSIVQGITEFLPVSSSAHIVLINKIFGFEQTSLIFDFTLHLGTLFAIVWFYKKRIVEILKNLNLLFGLGLTTIPVGIFYLIIKNGLDTWASSLTISAISLISVGVVFLFLKKIPTIKPKTIDEMRFFDYIYIGIFEAFALIRGVSRSGISLIGSLTNGLKLKEAVDVSFLIGIPVLILGLVPFLTGEFSFNSNSEMYLAVVGFFLSFLTGIIVIKYFIKKISYKFMIGIGIYRILVGIMTIVLSKFGAI